MASSPHATCNSHPMSEKAAESLDTARRLDTSASSGENRGVRPFLLLLATLVALLQPALGFASTAEIVILLRDRAGRDADLTPRSLTTTERAHFETIAGVRFVPREVTRDGAHVLELADDQTATSVDNAVARLRTEPSILYADHYVRHLEGGDAIAAAASVAEQRLDRIVLKFRDRALRDLSDRGEPLTPETVRTVVAKAGVPLYLERSMSGGAHVFRLFQRMPASSVVDIAVRLQADPEISWAEPAVRGRFQKQPNDLLFEDQWTLSDPLGGINATAAWEMTTGSRDVVVAVLDSGIRLEHPDLEDRLLPGRDFVGDTWRSGDFDGRDPSPVDPGDSARKAECGPSSPATPSTWHGTHVAGTIGAITNNREGIAGVDWAARLLPVRVGAKCGIDPIDLADAIRWAAGVSAQTTRTGETSVANPNPADVINLSIGFPGVCPPYVQDAISDAIAAGSLVVVAAGNDAQPASRVYPASCYGVLSVYGTDRRGRRTPYSNYGRVHLAAPGGAPGAWAADGVLSTDNRGATSAGSDSYGYKIGTSMAAPHVAGTAALLLSLEPTLRPGEIHNILADTARPFPAGGSLTCTNTGPRSCGAGILDAAAAVHAVARSR